jgi:hypothetical protein
MFCATTQDIDADTEMRLAASEARRLEDAVHAGLTDVIDCRRRQFAPALAFLDTFTQPGDQIPGALQNRGAIPDRCMERGKARRGWSSVHCCS